MKTYTAYFDHIEPINLSEETAKLCHMEKTFYTEENKIPVHFGTSYIDITLRFFDRLLHAGELACIRGKWVTIN